MIKGRYGGLETFFLKTGFSVHIRYQMKRLDELSWKIAKKIFWHTAAILETKMAAKMGENRVQCAQFFWKVYQWNFIFVVDFRRSKGFLERDIEFFSNFNPQFFSLGVIPIDIYFLWYFYTWEVFVTLYIKKMEKRKKCHDLQNFVVIVLVYHTCLYVKNWWRIFARTAVK